MLGSISRVPVKWERDPTIHKLLRARLSLASGGMSASAGDMSALIRSRTVCPNR